MNDDILWCIFKLSSRYKWARLCFLADTIWSAPNFRKWRNVVRNQGKTVADIAKNLTVDELTLWLHKMELTPSGMDDVVEEIYENRKQKVFYTLMRKETPKWINAIFEFGTTYGDREMLEWISGEPYREILTLETINIAFCLMALKNYMNLIKWLTKEFHLDIKTCQVRTLAFNRAISNGYIEMAEWIADRFKVCYVDVLGDRRGFLQCAENGQLDALKWLVKRYNFTGIDLGRTVQYAVNLATIEGHLDIIKFLVEHFNAGARFGIMNTHNGAIKFAVENNHSHIIEYLRKNFG